MWNLARNEAINQIVLISKFAFEEGLGSHPKYIWDNESGVRTICLKKPVSPMISLWYVRLKIQNKILFEKQFRMLKLARNMAKTKIVLISKLAYEEGLGSHPEYIWENESGVPTKYLKKPVSPMISLW